MVKPSSHAKANKGPWTPAPVVLTIGVGQNSKHNLSHDTETIVPCHRTFIFGVSKANLVYRQLTGISAQLAWNHYYMWGLPIILRTCVLALA